MSMLFVHGPACRRKLEGGGCQGAACKCRLYCCEAELLEGLKSNNFGHDSFEFWKIQSSTALSEVNRGEVHVQCCGGSK